MALSKAGEDSILSVNLKILFLLKSQHKFTTWEIWKIWSCKLSFKISNSDNHYRFTEHPTQDLQNPHRKISKDSDFTIKNKQRNTQENRHPEWELAVISGIRRQPILTNFTFRITGKNIKDAYLMGFKNKQGIDKMNK